MRLDFRGGLQSIKRASILAIFYITRETRLELPARGMTLHTDTFLSIETIDDELATCTNYEYSACAIF